MENKNLFWARLVLGVNLIVFAGFVVAFAFWPEKLMKLLLGVSLENAAAVCDIRAMYAGLSAAATVWIFRSFGSVEAMRSGLRICVYLPSGMALSRVLSFALQADLSVFNLFTGLSFASEASAAVIGALVLRTLRSE